MKYVCFVCYFVRRHLRDEASERGEAGLWCGGVVKICPVSVSYFLLDGVDRVDEVWGLHCCCGEFSTQDSP